jgi:macrophage erythroblast attacher
LYLPELQRAVATLAFTAKTTCTTYAALFSEQQWQDLVALFYQDLYRLHGLPSDSGLSAHLQAGLAALNTPLSYQPSCGREDPLHLPAFQKLAMGLPYAKHVQSKLICSLTRQLMNEANPPMVLPNGYVYSERAVEQIRGANAGKVVCPKTGNAYHVDELRRAYVV